LFEENRWVKSALERRAAFVINEIIFGSLLTIADERLYYRFYNEADRF